MIQALLAFALQDHVYAPLVEPSVPAPVAVKLGRTLPFGIRRLPAPVPEKTLEPKTGALLWRIKGRTVRIKCPAGGAWVLDDSVVGRDGSVGIHYFIRSEPGSTGYVIETNHPQKKLLAKAFDPGGEFQDAKDYVSSYYKDPDIAIPQGPPTTIQVIHGFNHELGLGEVLKVWWPNRVLVQIPVDSSERPCGGEFTDHNDLRLYDRGRVKEIGAFDYVGCLPDQSLILKRMGAIYFWKDGRLSAGYRLPPNWETVLVNTKGDVLVRHRIRRRRSDETSEEIWAMGIYRAGTLYPISFQRPPKSYDLLWRDTQSFDSEDRIRFSAFIGNDERYYELDPGAGVGKA
jgi:hypothetical protein